MRNRIIPITLFVILALALAACAPITATPPTSATRGVTSGTPDATAPAPAATPGATSGAISPLPTPGTATAASGSTGMVFAGTVRHAGSVVPNARVELRELGWAVNRTPAVASTLADDQGRFRLENPPAGSYSVIGIFPDGEMDAGGWPPVNIGAGQSVTDFAVQLERRLTLLSPIAGATTSALPTLTWNAAPGAVNYRVWLLGAGTTEMMMDQTTTDTSLGVTKNLEPGLYQWVVNGLNAQGQVVATGDETFTVGGSSATPAAGGTPAVVGTPSAQGGDMPRLPDQNPASAAARAALAKRLSVDPAAVQHVSVEPRQWSDSCLGVRRAREMCAQVITPGWLIIMTVDGKQYEAHTDQEGVVVRFAGLQEGRAPVNRGIPSSDS